MVAGAEPQGVLIPVTSSHDLFYIWTKNEIMTTQNNRKMNKMGLGISLGLAIGAVSGTLIGMVSNDVALWLSVGIGSGMAIGTAIGAALDKKE